jgi:hypothetical protein
VGSGFKSLVDHLKTTRYGGFLFLSPIFWGKKRA